MSLLLKLVGAATQPVVIHDYRVRGSVVVTSWTPVNPVLVQGINASYVVRGSTGINGWSYVVPVASGAVDTPINPGVGSITFTGYAPSIAQGGNQSVVPNVGSLTLTGYAPTLAQTANRSLVPGVGSLAITGYAPTLAQSANQAVVPGAGSLTITGYAPTVAQSTSSSYGVVHNYVSRGSQSVISWLNDGLGSPAGSINPGAGTLTITGYAPNVAQSVNQSVVPGVGNLTITGYAPSVVQAVNVAINPGVGSLAITGYAPTLAQTANQSLVPLAGVLVLTGYAPSVAQAAPGASFGVCHHYSSRGSMQVVSWLNDGLSAPAVSGATGAGPWLRRRRR